jgi:hypothetical protein
MKRALALLVCLPVILLHGCAFHSVTKARTQKREREKEARTAAQDWLGLIDAGNYARAYAEEPTRLRAATTEEQFIHSMESRRAPFGKVLSRKFIGAAFTSKLTGSPDGRYESILFRTSFEHKKLAAERVILAHEEEQWRVVDYRVY